MSSIFRRPWFKRWVDVLNRPWAEVPRKQRRQTRRLNVEPLETRLVLSGDPPGHYSGIFTSDHEWLDTSGTYYIDANLTVANGATLTVGSNVQVQIQGGATLTDNGVVTFAAGPAVAFAYKYGGTTRIVVGNGGLLTANGTTFRADSFDGSNFTQIYIAPGGHLQASKTTFNVQQLYLDNGSILGAGDLVGDGFDLPLWLPASDVQYLSGSGSDNLRFQDINILDGGSLSSGQTLALNLIGTATTANLRYIFRNFTVGSGAALNVAPNVSVILVGGDTLTDNGVVTFAAGPAVAFAYRYGGTTRIAVGNGGLLTANGTTFRADSFDGSNFTQIYIAPGGQLQASKTTFNVQQLYLDNGSILSAGDLVDDGFDVPLWLPASDVQYLSGSGSDNLRFQDINILDGGSLSSGQTLALNLIGTATTANLRYIFRNFTVGSGAALNVAPNVSVILVGSDTLTDNGVMTFAAGPAVTFAYRYGGTTRIVVGNGGLLTDNGTTFRADSFDGSNFTQIYIAPGGHLQASKTTFNVQQLYLDNGSILSASDLVSDGFDLPLWLPPSDVQYLSGAGSDNLRFQDINILDGGSLSSGQTLALNLIGTATTANLRYIFRNFTVGSGAALNVAPNVSVILVGSDTLTDNGVMTFAAGPAVAFAYRYGGTTRIVVGNGGLLTANGTTFRADSFDGSNFTQIYIAPGGHLQASKTTFNVQQLYLDNGSILSAGDLVSDGFDLPLWLPASDVQYLSGTGSDNLRFQDINILDGGSLSSGQTLTLNLIGTATTANLRYIFRNFTVGSGAALNVAPNVSVILVGSDTLTDNGVMTFAAGPAVTFAYRYGGTTRIVVGNGGLLTDNGTTFRADSFDSSNFTQIYIAPGGHLQASKTTFNVQQLYLDKGSTENIQFVKFFNQLQIDSGALLKISYNDFQSINLNGIVAIGDRNATIDLSNNYWGTTDSAQIEPKIKDHRKDSTLPLVQYDPPLSARPVHAVVAAANVTFSTAAQNVTLTADLASPSGLVTEGTVTFTVLNVDTPVGSAVIGNVVNGKASASYGLPAGLGGGAYTIQAVYNGTANFAGPSDSSQVLTVSPAASTTQATSALATFNTATQTISLTATIASPAGTVNEGTVTFTILKGNTVAPSAVTVQVTNGAASTNYDLPPGLGAGTYTIQAVYNGTADFRTSTDRSQTLTITAAVTTTVAADATVHFITGVQKASLSATVISPAGTINEGTVTFTILKGSDVIGSSATVPVTNGAASTNYDLPRGLGAGLYTIQAAYNGSLNFAGSSDNGHSLIVDAGPSTFTWFLALSGDFSDPARWHDQNGNNGVPGANDEVIINFSGLEITSYTAETVRILKSNSRLTIAGGTFTVGDLIDPSSLNELVINAGAVFQVVAGTTSITNGSANMGTYSVALGASLLFTGGTNLLMAGSSLTGGGQYSLTGGTLSVDVNANVNAPANFTLMDGTLAGAGTLTITGTTFNWIGGTMGGMGATVVAADGILALSGGTNKVLDTRLLTNAGTVTFSGAGQLNTGNFAQINNSGTWTLAGDQQFVSSFGALPVFTNMGTLTKAGGTGTSAINLVFNNNGTVNINSGTLELTLGGLSSGAFNASAGTILQFAGGTQRLTAGASLPSAGLTQVTGGAVLVIDAIVAVQNIGLLNGSLELTSNGILNVSGNYDQTVNGTLIVHIGGTSAFGTLNVMGTANLAGMLQVNLDNNFVPSLGETYRILTFGTVNGDFGTKTLPVLGSGRQFTSAYDASGLTLSVGSN